MDESERVELTPGRPVPLELRTMMSNAVSLVCQNCRFSSGSLIAVLSSVLDQSSSAKWVSLHHCGVNNEVLSGVLAACDNKMTSSLSVLDLSHNELDTAAMTTTSQLLECVPSIDTLVLDMNQLEISALRALTTGLIERKVSLKHLSLSFCGMTDDVMSPIMSLLKSQSKLSSLDLSGNSLGVDAAERLASHLRKGAGKVLEELDLSYTSLGDGGCRVVTHALSSGYLPKLRVLRLKGVGATGKSLCALLKVAAATGIDLEEGVQLSLEELDISGNTLFISKKDKAHTSGGLDPKTFVKAIKSVGIADGMKQIETSLGMLAGFGKSSKKAKRYGPSTGSHMALPYKASQSNDKGKGVRAGKAGYAKIKDVSRPRERREMSIVREKTSRSAEDSKKRDEKNAIKALAALLVDMGRVDSAGRLNVLHIKRVGLTDVICSQLRKTVLKKMKAKKAKAVLASAAADDISSGDDREKRHNPNNARSRLRAATSMSKADGSDTSTHKVATVVLGQNPGLDKEKIRLEDLDEELALSITCE